MRVHAHDSDEIVFREHVGTGTYRGVEFRYSIARSPAGTLIGLPVVEFDGGQAPMVVVELGDILPLAYRAAFEEKETGGRNG